MPDPKQPKAIKPSFWWQFGQRDVPWGERTTPFNLRSRQDVFTETARRTREKYPQATLASGEGPFSIRAPTQQKEYLPMKWSDLQKVHPGYGQLRDYLLKSGIPEYVEAATFSDELDSELLGELSLIAQTPAFKDYLNQYQPEQRGLEGNLQGAQFMPPEKRAFEISQSGNEQEALNVASENRYVGQRQAAEGKGLEDEQKQRQKQAVEIEKKKMALKGPGEWMKYMTELGEEPSWLGYWFARKT